MDKFLYLVRVYLNASFRLFAKNGWQNAEQLDEYMAILSETPLNARDTKIPNGMRYHVIDIYVDELDRLEGSDEDEMPIEILLQPLRALGRESLTKTVRERVKEALEDERVKEWLREAGVERQPNEGQPSISASVGKDAGWNGIGD
jgi:ribosomal RNA-processing protein 1